MNPLSTFFSTLISMLPITTALSGLVILCIALLECSPNTRTKSILVIKGIAIVMFLTIVTFTFARFKMVTQQPINILNVFLISLSMILNVTTWIRTGWLLKERMSRKVSFSEMKMKAEKKAARKPHVGKGIYVEDIGGMHSPHKDLANLGNEFSVHCPKNTKEELIEA